LLKFTIIIIQGVVKMMDRMTTGFIAGGLLGIAATAVAWTASDSRLRRNVVRGTKRLARKASHMIGDSFDY
jgi:hypothetical protein